MVVLQVKMKHYLMFSTAMTAYMDMLLERITNVFKESGLWNNTVMIFSSGKVFKLLKLLLQRGERNFSKLQIRSFVPLLTFFTGRIQFEVLTNSKAMEFSLQF